MDHPQMNLILNSSIVGRNEIELLSALSNWLISYISSGPSIGQTDDSVIGLFELTLDNVRLNKYHAMLLYSNTTYTPNFTGVDTITGRDTVSMILEETPINFNSNPNYYNEKLAPYMDYNPADIKVNITQGKHSRGVLDKKSIGKGATNGLYHIICNEYGPDKALDLMFNMQQMAISYILQRGYTIGILDLMLDKDTKSEIDRIAADIINKSNLITEKLNKGEIIPPIGMTVEEFYEKQQIEELRTADDFIEPVLSAVDPHRNNLLKLIVSGSKGTIDNMVNMVSSIGQKLINSERIRQTFGHKRTLAYFPRFDTSPESRGYIINSYIVGMNSYEYVFNAMNARFDIISKALNTSVTGEQNRKSIKNLESIVINNLRFAVKHNSVIQLLYGEDGIDPRYVEKVKFSTVKMSDAAIRAKYMPVGGEDIITESPELSKIIEDEISQVMEDRNRYREIFMKVECIGSGEKISDERLMPVNIERIILDTLREYSDAVSKPPTVKELLRMHTRVKALCDALPYILINEIQEKLGSKVPEHIQHSVWLLLMLLRSHLHVSALLVANMSEKVLIVILEKVRLILSSALIDPGTAAGIIAAQSFSGPLTQYMLDAHHRSATGGTSKSGMTHVKEVLAARDVDKLESPSMMLYLKPEIETDRGLVQEIANNIEAMKLKQFVRSYQIFFEKYGDPIHPSYTHERAQIQEFARMNPLLNPPGDLLKWCIRVVIDKSTLILKNMSLEMIITKIRETYPDLYVVYTPENASEIVIRIYMRLSMKDMKGNTVFKGVIGTDNIVDLAKEILETIIRGVNGITNTNVVKREQTYVKDDGGLGVKEIFGIETVGTNFYGVLSNRHIDGLRIQTDAIMETYRMLGIEAARLKIISELRKLSSCNHRHYLIYADEMTRTGRVTSIERGGLSTREASNYLLRIGFSSPIQTLEEASVNAVVDEVTGVTAPLLVGSVPKFGTLYNSIHVDPEMVRKNIKKPDDILGML
jgi:DNA-directed RNA polymerase beta' subunit